MYVVCLQHLSSKVELQNLLFGIIFEEKNMYIYKTAFCSLHCLTRAMKGQLHVT
jgi:hypothetical protein